MELRRILVQGLTVVLGSARFPFVRQHQKQYDFLNFQNLNDLFCVKVYVIMLPVLLVPASATLVTVKRAKKSRVDENEVYDRFSTSTSRIITSTVGTVVLRSRYGVRVLRRCLQDCVDKKIPRQAGSSPTTEYG
jgi:hypothetical protein